MDSDGLYEPLGRNVRPSRPGAETRRAVFIGVGALFVASGLFWGVRHVGPPSDAKIVVVPIEQGASVKPAPVAVQPLPAPATTRPQPGPAVISGDAVEQESGVRVIRPPGATAPPGTFVQVPQPDSLALARAPDPRLIEKGRYGILPRRGADGARPADVYARPVGVDPKLGANAPRIALFVGGMGLNRMLTSAAAQALPPAVTLGFAPYGGDLGQQVENARALGHEAVLQVPMESFNTPDGSAMPRMLRTGDGPQQTSDNLHWQMSRFVGYAGVSSFLGGKFTSDADAFRPVLKDVADRGLFFFDDGTAPRSLATSLSPGLGLPAVRADVTIDALGEPEAIDAGLKKLEALARSRGWAVGATTGLPTAVDRIAAFTAGLASRNVGLVPVSVFAADRTR